MPLKIVLGDFKYGKIMYPAGDIYIGNSLSLYGEYSEGETALYRQFVKEGNTVVEVGANIGSLTIPLAQMVGESGKVICYEPQRIIFQLLAGNVAVNNLRNVYTYNKGVGKTNESIVIEDVCYNAGANIGGFALKPQNAGYKVDVVTLDSQDIQECDFLKIDVEGMELDVLEGGENLINRTEPIIYLEIENDILEKEKEWLKAHGYKLYRHTVPLFNPDNYFGSMRNVFLEMGKNFEKTQKTMGQACSFNMIAIPKKRKIIMKNFEEL